MKEETKPSISKRLSDISESIPANDWYFLQHVSDGNTNDPRVSITISKDCISQEIYEERLKHIISGLVSCLSDHYGFEGNKEAFLKLCNDVFKEEYKTQINFSLEDYENI